LILRAVTDLYLDPGRSYMVGDTLKDIEAGTRAGAQGILVRTGYGTESAAVIISNRDGVRSPGETERLRGEHVPFRPVHVAEDLHAAVQWIMRNRKP
jgi:ribonucleotide monophosphatase NagD (HAD superfamily)